MQKFLSLQKVKLPVAPDQICQQWETLWGLLKHPKTGPIARIALLSCHAKGFFLSLHPSGNIISDRGWVEWPHKTQITLGWKAAIGKKEGTYHFMSQKKGSFLPPKTPVPKIQDCQILCNGDWELPRRLWRKCKSSKVFLSSSLRVGFACRVSSSYSSPCMAVTLRKVMHFIWFQCLTRQK